MGAASPEHKSCWWKNMVTVRSEYKPFCLLQSTPFCRRVISLHSLHLCAPCPFWNNAMHASQTKLPLKAREFSLSLTLSSSCFVSGTKGRIGFPLFFYLTWGHIIMFRTIHVLPSSLGSRCIFFQGSLFPHSNPVLSRWHTHLYNKINNNKAGVDFV